MNKEKPVALVTGAAKRIGAAIVAHLHKQGYTVVIHYNNSENEARSLTNQLNTQLNTQAANTAYCVQAELNSKSAVDQLANRVIQVAGRCDLLVNNASSYYPTPVGEITDNHWNDLFSANAQAPLFLAQALADSLTATEGSIINIADIHAQRPLKNHTVYCMAKAANIMLTKSLALELAPKVRVNGIAPGAILWPESEGEAPIVDDTMLKKIPQQKLGGVDAILAAVDYLLQKNNYLTGQIIPVDGGRTLLQ